MVSKKLSYNYRTGDDDLSPDGVRGPVSFTRYAKAHLGCEVPVFNGRGRWFAQLKEEMEAQGWTWDDMIRTVQYVKGSRIHVEKIHGLLYYVHKAERWAKERENQDLHANVSQAISLESDEMWLRRLRLAKGKALERVYDEWKRARNEI